MASYGKRKYNKKAGQVIANGGGLAFGDFSKGLYLLDTPRTLSEQAMSLALTGGQNIWSEKGALVSQHGYQTRGQIDAGEQVVGWTQVVDSNASFFLLTLSGDVYFFSASEGLKKYATKFDVVANPIVTRRGSDLICHTGGMTYLFGSYYEESSYVPIVENVTLSDYTTYYEFVVPVAYGRNFWAGKDLCIDRTHHFEILTTRLTQDKASVVCRVRIVDAEHVAFPNPVSVGEKSLLPVDLIYKPENIEPETPGATAPVKPDEPITPQLMAVCDNRLFVVDVTGYVYYSAIGIVDNFQETSGAGKFGGFYNDTSQFLAIEKYANGGIIVKNDGIYYFTLTSKELNIARIFVGGQEYASDHVIVGDKIYAYDTNTGAIVNAIQINVFGNAVSGKPVISSEFLNAENMGISSSKRHLTYNAESGVFILYYGANLNQGIVLVQSQGTIFPRKLNKDILTFIGFNQGVAFVTDSGEIMQDFKKGTIVPDIPPVADFEPIGLRGNQMSLATLIEITELNGLNFEISTSNAGQSFQRVRPSFQLEDGKEFLPPLLYSATNRKYSSYAELSKWAEKKSQITRIYAPLSGREGISISIQFPANTDFCLNQLSLPDFSQGE